MAKLKYVGAYPDTDNALGVNAYSNTRFTQQGVVAADVTAELNTAKAPLSLKTYIDQQDALYVAKTYVDTQDALLTNATQLGAVSGIAKLSAAGKVTAPTPLVNAADARTYHYTYSTLRTTTSSLYCTTFTIPDPGFRWLPIWTGWTQGRWFADGGAWPVARIAHSDGHTVARGLCGTSWATTDGEKMPINMTPTTDKNEGYSYVGQHSFYLYYERGWGTGTVEVGENSAWFSCLVVPASNGMAPTPIT